MLLEQSNSKLSPNKKGDDVRLTTSDLMARHVEDDVFDMIKQSYEKVGGNPKISSSDDIEHEYDVEYVSDIDEDPKPDVVVLGNVRHGGLKIGAMGTDGSSVVKEKVVNLQRWLFNHGAWAEVSGAPAHIVLNKLHIKPIDDPDRVRQLLDGKAITWYGEHPKGEFPGTFGWYGRKIGNNEHIKIIVGDV